MNGKELTDLVLEARRQIPYQQGVGSTVDNRVLAARLKLERMAKYREVFLLSENGQWVLRDLMANSFFFNPVFDDDGRTSSTQAAFRDGQRSIVNGILDAAFEPPPDAPSLQQSDQYQEDPHGHERQDESY